MVIVARKAKVIVQAETGKAKVATSGSWKRESRNKSDPGGEEEVPGMKFRIRNFRKFAKKIFFFLNVRPLQNFVIS